MVDTQQITKDQHYLPQFWSKLYMGRSKRDGFEVGLYRANDCLVGNCRTDKVSAKCIAETFAFEPYLYETDPSNPDNFVEKLLSSFEGKVASLFRKLYGCACSYNLQHSLSDDEIALLFRFVNVSLIRQPDSVIHFKGNEEKYSFWDYRRFMLFAVYKTIPPFGYERIAYSFSIVHVDAMDSKERFILGETGVVGRTEWLLYDRFPHKFAFFPLTPTVGVCLEGQFYHTSMIDNCIYQWTAPGKVVKYFNELQRRNLTHGHYLKSII